MKKGGMMPFYTKRSCRRQPHLKARRCRRIHSAFEGISVLLLLTETKIMSFPLLSIK